MKPGKFIVRSGPLEYAGVTYRTGDELTIDDPRHAEILTLLGKVERKPRRRSIQVTMEMRADDDGDNAAPYNTKAAICESG